MARSSNGCRLASSTRPQPRRKNVSLTHMFCERDVGGRTPSVDRPEVQSRGDPDRRPPAHGRLQDGAHASHRVNPQIRSGLLGGVVGARIKVGNTHLSPFQWHTTTGENPRYFVKIRSHCVARRTADEPAPDDLSLFRLTIVLAVDFLGFEHGTETVCFTVGLFQWGTRGTAFSTAGRSHIIIRATG